MKGRKEENDVFTCFFLIVLFGRLAGGTDLVPVRVRVGFNESNGYFAARSSWTGDSSFFSFLHLGCCVGYLDEWYGMKYECYAMRLGRENAVSSFSFFFCRLRERRTLLIIPN